METKTKNVVSIVSLVLVVAALAFGNFFFIKKINAVKNSGQVANQNSTQNNTGNTDQYVNPVPKVDPVIQGQLDDLKKLQVSNGPVTPPTPEVVAQQLDDLRKLQAQPTAGSAQAPQEIKPPTAAEIQDQLKQLQQLNKK